MASEATEKSTFLWEYLMKSTDWSTVVDAPYSRPEEIPAYIRGMLGVGSDLDPDWAAGALDGTISYDESVPGAEHVAVVLLAALPILTDSLARARVLRVLDDTSGPNCDPNDPNDPTSGQFERVVASGFWLYYGLITDEIQEVRFRALRLASWADPDRGRAERILDHVAMTHPDHQMRVAATRLKPNLRGRQSGSSAT